MNTEVTKVKSYQQKVTFEVSAEEMTEQYKKSFASFRKKAAIKGFRKGKAPESIVKSMYGKAIEAQSIDDAINDAYRKYLTESKIFPLSQAHIEDVDYKENEGLKFATLIEVHPEVELKKYTGFDVEMLDPSVTEEEMTTAIDRVREDFATIKAVDAPVAEGNMVKIKLKPASLADTEWEAKEIEVGKNPEDVMDKEIIGMKAGEEKEIEANGEKVKILIEAVEEKILPELTDDFVKTIDKKYESLDMFKEEVNKNLKAQKEQHSKSQMLNTLIEKIIAEHDELEVPPSVLDGYLGDMVENAKKQYGQVGITDDILRNIYKDTAERSLKWEYIRQNIMKKEEIKVEKGDDEKFFADIAEKTNIELEKIKKMYKSPERKNQLNMTILDEKLNNFLEENNNVEVVAELTKPETPEATLTEEKEAEKE